MTNRLIITYLENLIKCPSCCNGRSVGEDAGYSECSDCANDGHRLHGMEGTNIDELLNYRSIEAKS